MCLRFGRRPVATVSILAELLRHSHDISLQGRDAWAINIRTNKSNATLFLCPGMWASRSMIIRFGGCLWPVTGNELRGKNSKLVDNVRVLSSPITILKLVLVPKPQVQYPWEHSTSARPGGYEIHIKYSGLTRGETPQHFNGNWAESSGVKWSILTIKSEGQRDNGTHRSSTVMSMSLSLVFCYKTFWTINAATYFS